MPEIIVTQTEPLGSNNFVEVDLNKNDFDNLIWSKGSNVFIETAFRCPCKSKGGENLSGCRNCGGTGWFYINKKRTKMYLASFSIKTNFKDYGEQSIGRMSVTAMSSQDLAYMDRITNLTGESIFSQVLYPVVLDNSFVVAKTVYEISSIIDIFAFESATTKLIKLDQSQYQIEGNIIKVVKTLYNTIPNFSITIRYRHHPVYHITDVPREIINTTHTDLDFNQISINSKFPLHAVADKAHLILGTDTAYDQKGNYLGNILDNSYLPILDCQ